jgi:sugar phosphate isomerase/epimerase
MTKAKIGLIGIVGDEAKRDYWGTMERVAASGYQGIEGEGPLLQHGDPAENLRRLHDLGLQILTVSASRESLSDDLPGLIARAHALQSPRATVWWGPCVSRDEILRDADLYNAAGAELAREGVTLCYHNHEHEFRTAFNGVYALDILAEHTDPAALAFEIDVAWVTFGGEDPVRVLQRMAGRVPAIHVKDLYALSERGQFTTVGTGVVNVKGSIETALALGIEWIVIEQDHLRNLTAFETITASYLNLKEAGLV